MKGLGYVQRTVYGDGNSRQSHVVAVVRTRKLLHCSQSYRQTKLRERARKRERERERQPGADSSDRPALTSTPTVESGVADTVAAIKRSTTTTATTTTTMMSDDDNQCENTSSAGTASVGVGRVVHRTPNRGTPCFYPIAQPPLPNPNSFLFMMYSYSYPHPPFHIVI